MATSRYGFPREGRLRKRKIIESIFAKEGTLTFKSFPVLFVYLLSGDDLSVVDTNDVSRLQVMFSVPKRKLKKAHERNLIRRRMREAWRLNNGKTLLQLSRVGLRISVVAIYLHPGLSDYSALHNSVQSYFKHLSQRPELNKGPLQ